MDVPLFPLHPLPDTSGVESGFHSAHSNSSLDSTRDDNDRNQNDNKDPHLKNKNDKIGIGSGSHGSSGNSIRSGSGSSKCIGSGGSSDDSNSCSGGGSRGSESNNSDGGSILSNGSASRVPDVNTIIDAPYAAIKDIEKAEGKEKTEGKEKAEGKSKAKAKTNEKGGGEGNGTGKEKEKGRGKGRGNEKEERHTTMTAQPRQGSHSRSQTHSITSSGKTLSPSLVKKYRGVHLKKSGRFNAMIWSKDKKRNVRLGTFDNAEDAARRYDQVRGLLVGVDSKNISLEENFHISSLVSQSHSISPLYHNG